MTVVDEDEELMRPENWEEHGVVHEGQRLTSVVYSVRFGRDEIELVREAAAKLHKKTSEFIREAAVDRALASRGSLGAIALGGGTVFASEACGTRNDAPALKGARAMSNEQ